MAKLEVFSGTVDPDLKFITALISVPGFLGHIMIATMDFSFDEVIKKTLTFHNIPIQKPTIHLQSVVPIKLVLQKISDLSNNSSINSILEQILEKLLNQAGLMSNSNPSPLLPPKENSTIFSPISNLTEKSILMKEIIENEDKARFFEYLEDFFEFE